MTVDTRDWTETKRRLRERWPGLPEEALDVSNGERSALLGLLQDRLGYVRTDAEQDLDEILGGATVVLEDVGDAESHAGTSDRTLTEGRAELPNQSREGVAASDASSTAGEPPAGAVPEGVHGADEPPAGGGGGGWGRDPWDRMHGKDDGMGSPGIRKMMLGIAAGVGMLIAVRLLAGKRRKRKQSKSEQVVAQARQLLEEISERMPSVEELRDRVRSLEELREKKMATAAKR